MASLLVAERELDLQGRKKGMICLGVTGAKQDTQTQCMITDHLVMLSFFPSFSTCQLTWFEMARAYYFLMLDACA